MSATTSARRRVRRNRITSSDAVVVGVLAGASGVVAMWSGAAPSGGRLGDVVLTAGVVALVSWAGASAPWWVLAVAAAIATVSATSLLLGVLGAVGFLLAAVTGSRAWSVPWARTLSVGLSFNVLLRWDVDLFHGFTALVTGVVMVAVFATGMARRGRYVRARVRRLALVAAAVTGAVCVVALLALLIGQGRLREGERALRAGVAALRDGDVSGAADAFAEAGDRIADADTVIGGPWLSIARGVPLLGQHVRAVQGVTDAGLELARSAAGSVEQVNLESLRMVQGVIDLDAIAVLGGPLEETAAALTSAVGELGEARTPWLIGPLGSRLGQLYDEVASMSQTARRAAGAARLAPDLLGADGPRRYFVAFTTPAEARGLGGFMGTYAELLADDGRLTVVRTGTTSELNGGWAGTRPVLDGLDPYRSRYGPFGAGEGDGSVSVDYWSNITMSPDLAAVTEVIAQLYPAVGGDDIDGVIVVDAVTVARFLVLTGPVTVDGPDGPLRLDEHNATDYLLRGQYADIAADDARDAVLAELTETLLARVFGGDLPAPAVLASTLGPAIDEGRLLLWSRHETDQRGLVDLGIGGALEPPVADGLLVVTNNASANKLDTYLRRSITYEGVVVEGQLRTTATVRLTNSAPAGLPDDVGGNPFGLPVGTNRSYLSIYSPLGATAATVDGRPRRLDVDLEAGWQVHSTVVDIPPGGEVVVTVELRGALDPDQPYSLWLRSQPMVLPDVVRVTIDGAEGALVRSHGPRLGTDVIGGDVVGSD